MKQKFLLVLFLVISFFDISNAISQTNSHEQQKIEIVKKIYAIYSSQNQNIQNIKSVNNFYSTELNTLFKKANKSTDICIESDPIIDGQDWDANEITRTLKINSEKSGNIVATFSNFKEPKKVEFVFTCNTKCFISDVKNIYNKEIISLKDTLKSCVK